MYGARDRSTRRCAGALGVVSDVASCLDVWEGVKIFVLDVVKCCAGNVWDSRVIGYDHY